MIFLSHSWTDKPAARRLVEALAVEGVPAWIDEQQLDGGERLRAALLEAIAGSGVYLYLVSEEANRSEWVQDELRFAIGLELEKRLKVIPVRLVGDDTALPTPLAGRLYRSMDVATGGAARLAHDLKKESGSNAVPDGSRVSATVRLLATELTHTLDEARRLSAPERVEVLFLNEGYERIDALYWKLSETRLPLTRDTRQTVETAAGMIADMHKRIRRMIDALTELSRRYLGLTADQPHKAYFESGYLEQLRVLLHHQTWLCEYLTHLRDGTQFDGVFVSRKDLPPPFTGHLCDFKDDRHTIGGVHVPAHGHPFAGKSPPLPWGLSNPFGDMFDGEIGQSLGYSIARRLIAGTLTSTDMLNPETLQYGLS